MPSIELLIPCYNAGRFLPRLMEGVRGQSVPFDRILCYDDGSTDDTVSVARALGLPILTPNPNRGVSHARNRLVDAARADWIHFHDADDRISPQYVERLAPLADGDTDVACCDADWIEDDPAAKLVVAWHYDSGALAGDSAAYLLTHPLSLNNTLMRRSKWMEIGGCDERLGMWEDADVTFRLALAGARFRHRPEVLTWSLRRAESFSHDYRQNWRWRLQALTGYAADPRTARLGPLLGQEAEKAAEALLALGDEAGARQALALCRQLGHTVPSTRHPLLRLTRGLLGPMAALRWQQRHRRKVIAKRQ